MEFKIDLVGITTKSIKIGCFRYQIGLQVPYLVGVTGFAAALGRPGKR